METGLVLAILGAAVAVILSGIGSSIGVGLAGQASAGVMSEDPERFGSLLPLTVLPGTQGVYGFVAGFLVIIKLGLVGGALMIPTTHQGLEILLASLPVGLCGLLSAIHQGRVCTAGVEMVAKQPAEFGKALTMGVIVEFYALLGLVITVLMLFGIKIG